MSQPMPPPGRSPYATTGMVAVGAAIVALLLVFAVSRVTRPPEEAAVAKGPSSALGPGIPPSVIRSAPLPPPAPGASGTTPTTAPAAPPARTAGAPTPAAPGASGTAANPSTPAAGSPPASAAASADPSLTGKSRPEDIVMARQLLMDGNETAMMPIDRAAGGADIPLATLKEQAYAIYTWLSVAPHLFPSSTRPVVAPDGSPPATAATDAIWADFDAFYQASTDAANVAYDASQAADITKFRASAMQLRMACDSCHDKYMHVFDPTTGK